MSTISGLLSVICLNVNLQHIDSCTVHRTSFIDNVRNRHHPRKQRLKIISPFLVHTQLNLKVMMYMLRTQSYDVHVEDSKVMMYVLRTSQFWWLMLLLSGCSHLPPCCAPEQQLCQPEGLPGRGEVSHLSITTDPNYFTINVSPIFFLLCNYVTQ